MRRPTGRIIGALLALAAMAPASAHAQIAWDTPRLIGPSTPGGFGAYWVRAATLPGDGDAAFATLTLPGLGTAVTLRGGIGNGAAEEPAGFGGIDLRAPITRHGPGQPLDIEWHTGIGVGVGAYQLASLPVGISVGRAWSSGSIWFAPWIAVGATAEYRRGEDAPDEEFAVEPTAEIGLDLALDPARRFVVRAATALGDRQAVSVGLLISGGS